MKALLLGVAMALSVAAPAFAQLSVDRLWVDLDVSEHQREDVLVRNDSKDRYYVSITPSRVTDPGTSKEARASDADPEKLGLMSTPNRVILDPGAQRSIRIVALGDAPTVDRVYRVRIAPQIGQLSVPAAAGGQRQVGLKILTAYEILVIIHPDHPAAKVRVQRTAANVELDNVGNSNILLYDGMACPAAKPVRDAGCKKLAAHRLYAASQWTIPIQTPGDVLLFRTRDGQDGPVHDVNY